MRDKSTVAKTEIKTYLPALIGVHAVAAGMVFFFHFNPFNPNSLPGRYLNTWHIGVVIFFVLSGFLITHRYFDNLQLGWAWARSYLRNRFARIYPIYFLLTMISFAAMHWGGPRYMTAEWIGRFLHTDRIVRWSS